LDFFFIFFYFFKLFLSNIIGDFDLRMFGFPIAKSFPYPFRQSDEKMKNGDRKEIQEDDEQQFEMQIGEMDVRRRRIDCRFGIAEFRMRIFDEGDVDDVAVVGKVMRRDDLEQSDREEETRTIGEGDDTGEEDHRQEERDVQDEEDADSGSRKYPENESR